MNNFVYDIPVKVYFGEDQLQYLGSELAIFGKRVLLTYGGGSIKRMGLYDRLQQELKKHHLEVFELSGIEPNPKIDSIRDGVNMCKEHRIDALLAVGGGSTIDATKWIAAGACVEHDPWDFFNKGAKIENALPFISILTLAATGSEMNSAGVISNVETKDKIGRASPLLLPKVSFLDPTNTYTVSAYQTACGAVDIMSHVMEVYFTMEKGLKMVDYFMEGLLKTVMEYAPIAIKEPDNYEARANLMWASSWAINGFIGNGKPKAWSCHPMEHQLSAVYDITHGLGLAILTPRWLRYCLDESNVSRYVRFGINVFGIDASLEPMEIAKESIHRLSVFFFETLALDNTFTKIGIGEESFEAMAKKACKDSVLQGFKPLQQKDIEAIYQMCL
ncbi:MAG: iron-containing alcohol dehydrogenase [Breznakia sp.]